MLTIVLADTEVELVTGERDDGLAFSGSRTVPVLDSFTHKDAVRRLPGAERRGRPDIVHMSLSLCQGSALNRRYGLRVYVHTRDDEVIAVHPRARVPPNYIEFLELLSKVICGEEVEGFSIHSKDLSTLVREIDADLVVALDPEGEPMDLGAVVRERSPSTVVAIIGAFPSGDFTSPARELADVRISLGPELLTVPAVLCEILCSFGRG